MDYLCTGSQVHHILKTKVALLLTSRLPLPVQKGTGNVRHPLATAPSSSQRLNIVSILHESEAGRTDLYPYRRPAKPPSMFQTSSAVLLSPPANPNQRCNCMVLCEDPDSNHFNSNGPPSPEGGGSRAEVTPSPWFMGDHPCARSTLTAAGRTRHHGPTARIANLATCRQSTSLPFPRNTHKPFPVQRSVTLTPWHFFACVLFCSDLFFQMGRHSGTGRYHQSIRLARERFVFFIILTETDELIGHVIFFFWGLFGSCHLG